MKQIGMSVVIAAVSCCLFFCAQGVAGNSNGQPFTFQVISSQTKYETGGSDTFIYTDVLVAKMNDGSTVVYTCDQKGHECPTFEAGKEYSAEQDGKEIYVMMTFPDQKQAVPVRFKQVGDVRAGTSAR